MVALRFKERSAFTYRNLLDLNNPDRSVDSPLSVIGHIDLNAFFAQCEQIRLGLSLEDPVVCVQWNTLIAVSYAAKDYGITRMDRLEEAKLKCPDLIAAHTAVFKKGEPVWKYVDYLPSPANHKVSLDPYRREGKKVLNILRSECDLVEKASVDESFLDLGRLVFRRIVQIFPDLLQNMEDANDRLQPVERIPEGIEYSGLVIAKTDDLEDESGVPDSSHEFLVEDWDDLVILIGSMVCFELRKRIESELGYKTSGGVGRVKTIAKLASGYRKPDQQTIVRNDAIPPFLKKFKLSDFWSFGGKLGEYIKEQLGHDELAANSIRNSYSTIPALSKVLDNNVELATKIFKIVRGDLHSKIENKEFIKSMMSNKNFRGKSVSNTKDLMPWIRVFIGELMLRIKELDDEYSTVLRPTKLSLSLKGSTGTVHSKQCSINQPPKDYVKLEQLYHSLANELLTSLETSWLLQSPRQKMYPILHAGLGVSNFVDISAVNTLDDLIPNVQKRKLDPKNIQAGEAPKQTSKKPKIENGIDLFFKGEKKATASKPLLDQTHISDDLNKTCPQCGEIINLDEWQMHQDYHIAFNLDTKLNKEFEESYAERLLKRPDRQNVGSKSKQKKTDKNQSKLPF